MSRLKPFFCWLFHQSSREILLRGTHPLGLDDVVFCARCDRARGRGVGVLQLAPAMNPGS
ncbi:MAG: hypothetical protein J2P43_00385 [Candidatus Dormibacteraeota bacterium]|nr:hypothetical protein [Candidatus Dormibacteraeota bacterium]MBO0743445.1 hypothetical protein [Candidatus Dormibacteraeota bacterium]